MKNMLLMAKIVENDMTCAQVAKESGMSKNTLSNKINGYSPFTDKEIVKLCDILRITEDSDKCRIFLSYASQK